MHARASTHVASQGQDPELTEKEVVKRRKKVEGSARRGIDAQNILSQHEEEERKKRERKKILPGTKMKVRMSEGVGISVCSS